MKKNPQFKKFNCKKQKNHAAVKNINFQMKLSKTGAHKIHFLFHNPI